MIKTLVTLSESQIKKIKDVYKMQTPVRIRLSYEQIAGNGKHKIGLTNAQKSAVDESRKLQKGLMLDLSYNRIKTGGFTPFILAGLAALGSLSGGAAAITNAVKTSQHQSADEAEAKRHNTEIKKIAQRKKTLSLSSGIEKKRPNPAAKQF